MTRGAEGEGMGASGAVHPLCCMNGGDKWALVEEPMVLKWTVFGVGGTFTRQNQGPEDWK